MVLNQSFMFKNLYFRKGEKENQVLMKLYQEKLKQKHRLSLAT